jgi:lipid-A-disaccharide synthase
MTAARSAGGVAPHIFLVAGEDSGDRLGAALMRALKAHTGGRIRFSGVGGHDMAAEGLVSLFPFGDLAVMGFAAIPRSLVKIMRHIRTTADAVVAARPAVLVIIDSPEFTHRVARRVRAAAPAIPIVDYVSPSVWAWRPWRARAMRRYVDHVLALLPFEPAVYTRLGGPPCSFVGHPLTERVSDLRPNAEEALRRNAEPPIVLVMPGSRRSEIQRMLACFAETMARVRAHVGPIEIVLPTVPHLLDAVQEAVAAWPVPAHVVVEPAAKNAAFRIACAALAKSGTGTLELALAGVPMVAAYKVSTVEHLVGLSLINAPSAILANLVLGENVVPEFLQYDATPDRLTRALLPLLYDTPQRRAQIAAFSRLDAIMEIATASTSGRAAAIVLNLCGWLNQFGAETVASTRPTA